MNQFTSALVKLKFYGWNVSGTRKNNKKVTGHASIELSAGISENSDNEKSKISEAKISSLRADKPFQADLLNTRFVLDEKTRGTCTYVRRSPSTDQIKQALPSYQLLEYL